MYRSLTSTCIVSFVCVEGGFEGARVMEARDL